MYFNNNSNYGYTSRTVYTTAYDELDKNQILIGQTIPYDIVDRRGVLLVKAGRQMTVELKNRLSKWGKVFIKK